MCGHVATAKGYKGPDESGGWVGGNPVFRKYVWDPPSMLAAEIRAEAQQKELQALEAERNRREAIEAERKALAALESNRDRQAPSNAVDISKETRIALVIGNAKYQAVSRLENPGRDAAAIAETLHRLGFKTVHTELDLTREKLVDALRNFAADSATADWAVVYFAGHGIEINHTNYVIPVDANLASDRDVQYEAVPLDQILGAVEGGRKLRLVILDACRDNPFTRSMTRTIASRSIGRGLAAIEPERGTLVVYAAKDGQRSFDGSGDNSPFVTALLKQITVPGIEIRKLFDLVRDDVMESTGQRQQPYTYGSLSGRQEYFFAVKP